VFFLVWQSGRGEVMGGFQIRSYLIVRPGVVSRVVFLQSVGGAVSQTEPKKEFDTGGTLDHCASTCSVCTASNQSRTLPTGIEASRSRAVGEPVGGHLKR
jgi:hypothetical protein